MVDPIKNAEKRRLEECGYALDTCRTEESPWKNISYDEAVTAESVRCMPPFHRHLPAVDDDAPILMK